MLQRPISFQTTTTGLVAECGLVRADPVEKVGSSTGSVVERSKVRADPVEEARSTIGLVQSNGSGSLFGDWIVTTSKIDEAWARRAGRPVPHLS